MLFLISWYTVLSTLIRLCLYLNANNLSGYVSIYYINQIGFWDVWFIVGADTFYLRYICGYIVEIHYSRSHILSMYNYLWRKDLSNIKILVLQMHAIILICVFLCFFVAWIWCYCWCRLKGWIKVENPWTFHFNCVAYH